LLPPRWRSIGLCQFARSHSGHSDRPEMRLRGSQSPRCEGRVADRTQPAHPQGSQGSEVRQTTRRLTSWPLIGASRHEIPSARPLGTLLTTKLLPPPPMSELVVTSDVQIVSQLGAGSYPAGWGGLSIDGVGMHAMCAMGEPMFESRSPPSSTCPADGQVCAFSGAAAAVSAGSACRRPSPAGRGSPTTVSSSWSGNGAVWASM
jgi:hypothetical protein